MLMIRRWLDSWIFSIIECSRSFIVLGRATRRALISIVPTMPVMSIISEAVFGIGTPSLQNRDTVPDWTKIHFSGRLASQTRNAEGLEAILADFFAIPTEIREFEGYWMKIPKENQCRLGASPETGSLGINAMAGERKYEVQLKFRIRMGPMALEDLRRLVPTGASFKRLKDWVLNYVDQEFYWDLQCVVKASAVPSISLGEGAMLGWTTWLKSQPFTRDPDDPIFDPETF